MKRIIKVYFVSCIIAAFAGTILLGYWLYGYIASNLEYKHLQEFVRIEEKEETGKKNSEEDTVIQKEESPDTPIATKCLDLDIKWEELLAVNEDIIGWLYIPAVEISYPLMQGKDNDYYLHRTTNQSYLFSGSIFLDYSNTRKLSDYHSIIYGHNMRDNSMFGRLKELSSQEVTAADPYFWICTRDRDYQYEIFSVHSAITGGETYQFFMNNSIVYEDWLQRMQDISIVDCDVKLSRMDRVVTLSTCTSDSGIKQVVQGVLQ